MKKIIYKEFPDNKNDVHLEKMYFIDGNFFQGFDSYLSALAFNSGFWEEYCEFYRKNKT